MFETKAFQHVLINVAKYERVRFVALAACTHESNAFRRVLITRANNERVQFGASNFHCGNQGVERVVVCAPWGACLAECVLQSGACLGARALGCAFGGMGLGTSFGVDAALSVDRCVQHTASGHTHCAFVRT